jgi:hypothetical protein
MSMDIQGSHLGCAGTWGEHLGCPWAYWGIWNNPGHTGGSSVVSMLIIGGASGVSMDINVFI